MPYILIDTETTGLDPATSDVIEIGACVRGPPVAAREALDAMYPLIGNRDRP